MWFSELVATPIALSLDEVFLDAYVDLESNESKVLIQKVESEVIICSGRSP